MATLKDPLESVRRRMKSVEGLGQLTPSQLDEMVEVLRQAMTHHHLVDRLSDHYKCSPVDLRALLIGQGAAYLHAHTDYSSTGSPPILQRLLQNQTERTMATNEKLQQSLNRVDAALQEARDLHDLMHRTLAALQHAAGSSQS